MVAAVGSVADSAAVVAASAGVVTTMAAGTIGMAAGGGPDTMGRTLSRTRRFSSRDFSREEGEAGVDGEAAIMVVAVVTAVAAAAVVVTADATDSLPIR